jgi:hypothetical protein
MPYHDDDGNELFPDLIPKPSLCVACAKDDNGDEMELILCNLNRLDQVDDREFQCFAFVTKKSGAMS